jgi:ABC-type branched-subunit amino acid transport system substrate-binding protein
MFTLLSGGFVHDAPTGEEMIIRTATQPSRSLADAAPDAPAAVIEVVNRALRFDRAERWSSASEMRDAVERAYESSYGEPLGPSALGPPPSRRNVASPGERSTVVGEGGADFAHDTTRPAFTSDGADAAGPTRAATATPVPPPLEEPTGSPTPAPIIAPRRPRRATPTLVLALAAIVGIGAFAAWRARPREPAPTTPRAVVRACSTNRECLASSAGKPAICRKEDGVCVALESPECQILAEPGDVENDATIWVGAMFPIRHPDPLHFGPMAQKAIELARRDFANTTGGLPPTRPGQPKRPLAVVLCDDHENAAAAAAHLASDVRVPAVIGFARSKEAFDLATNVFVPEGILVLASNTSSILRDIPRAPGKDEPRLAWRITTTLDMVVPPTAAVLSAVIEPAVRRAPGVLRPDEPVRVALVRVDSPTGQDLASSLLTALRFNGKSVAANGPSFLQLLTAETLDLPRAEETTRLVADLTRFAPHIIVSAGLRPEVILALERAWPATLSFRPRYLTDELLAVDIQSLVKERPEARKRLFAVNTRSDSEVLARFVVRYNEVFTPRKTATELNSAPYDGFYVFAYAAAALGDQPITGRALALSIPRLLPPGERVDVGPSGIFATVYALRDGKRVDLQGSVTTLDFNRDTGDATADFSMLCITPDAPGAPPVQIESGLTMRGGATKLEGELRCP